MSTSAGVAPIAVRVGEPGPRVKYVVPLLLMGGSSQPASAPMSSPGSVKPSAGAAAVGRPLPSTNATLGAGAPSVPAKKTSAAACPAAASVNTALPGRPIDVGVTEK